MLSLLQKPVSRSPETRVLEYFCVFCESRFLRPGSWRRHVEQHFFPDLSVSSVAPAVSPRVKQWISLFLKSQTSPFLASDLPAQIRAYADCVVCRNFRTVGHKVTAPSCRFQKDIRNLENHLRSHLCYYAYSCKICRPSNDQWIDTIVELRQSKRGKFFEIHPANRPFTALTSARETILDHIRSCHLFPTTEVTGKIVISSAKLIGFSPIYRLEELVTRVVSTHRRNLSTIKAVKKRDADCEEVQNLSPAKYLKFRNIRMQSEKSYFTISPDDDLMLDDINEIISHETRDSNPHICPIVTPPASSPGYDAHFSLTSATFLSQTPAQYTPVTSSPDRSGYSSSLSLGSQSSIHLSSGRNFVFYRSVSLPIRRPTTRQAVRRLNFDVEPNGPFEGLEIGQAVRKPMSFSQFLDTESEDVTNWSQPADTSFAVPYNPLVQKRVEEMLAAASGQALSQLSAQSVDEVLADKPSDGDDDRLAPGVTVGHSDADLF